MVTKVNKFKMIRVWPILNKICKGEEYPFTKDQYEQIINLLKNKTNTALSAAATGISTAFLASTSPKEWIRILVLPITW